jgi:hypothetical protein
VIWHCTKFDETTSANVIFVLIRLFLPRKTRMKNRGTKKSVGRLSCNSDSKVSVFPEVFIIQAQRRWRLMSRRIRRYQARTDGLNFHHCPDTAIMKPARRKSRTPRALSPLPSLTSWEMLLGTSKLRMEGFQVGLNFLLWLCIGRSKLCSPKVLIGLVLLPRRGAFGQTKIEQVFFCFCQIETADTYGPSFLFFHSSPLWLLSFDEANSS